MRRVLAKMPWTARVKGFALQAFVWVKISVWKKNSSERKDYQIK